MSLCPRLEKKRFEHWKQKYINEENKCKLLIIKKTKNKGYICICIFKNITLYDRLMTMAIKARRLWSAAKARMPRKWQTKNTFDLVGGRGSFPTIQTHFLCSTHSYDRKGRGGGGQKVPGRRSWLVFIYLFIVKWSYDSSLSSESDPNNGHNKKFCNSLYIHPSYSHRWCNLFTRKSFRITDIK